MDALILVQLVIYVMIRSVIYAQAIQRCALIVKITQPWYLMHANVMTDIIGNHQFRFATYVILLALNAMEVLEWTVPSAYQG